MIKNKYLKAFKSLQRCATLVNYFISKINPPAAMRVKDEYNYLII